jgi:hypothetical protein
MVWEWAHGSEELSLEERSYRWEVKRELANDTEEP